MNKREFLAGTTLLGVAGLANSVGASNTLFNGYLSEMTSDLGEHGADYSFVNNVGCRING